jgi:YidC/Oxa1 family membrane protein insertase
MSIPLLDTAVASVYPVVWQVATLLAPAGGAALAIVLSTLAIRLALLPLSLAVARGERARAVLAPRVQELQRKHGKDPQRLRTELAELYASAGASPFAGCLPGLLQVPFFIVTYRLFTAPSIAGHANALLNSRFLGVELSTHLLGGGHPLVFLPLLAIIAGLAWLTVHRAGGPSGVSRLLPFGTVLTAAVVPLAAVLYLVVSTAWTATVEAWLRRKAVPAPG